MRKLRGAIFSVMAAMSALLFIAIVVLWICGLRHYERWQWAGNGGGIQVGVSDGLIFLGIDDYRDGTIQFFMTPGFFHWREDAPPNRTWAHCSLAVADHHVFTELPCWWLLIVALPLPIARFVVKRRQSAVRFVVVFAVFFLAMSGVLVYSFFTAAINLELHQKLEARVTDVSLHDVPLADAIEFLQQKSGTAVTINWSALREVGVNPQSPVTLQLSDADFRTVLIDLLRGVDKRLDYAVENRNILISTADELATHTSTIAYPIGDLVYPAPSNSANSPAALSAQIGKLITDNIDPYSWQSEGGKSGVLRIHGNQMLITQTVGNHHTISLILEQLREGRRSKSARTLNRSFTGRWLLLGGLCICLLASIRSRRKARGTPLCLHCGYDLRATPHRCPECGTIPVGF